MLGLDRLLDLEKDVRGVVDGMFSWQGFTVLAEVIVGTVATLVAHTHNVVLACVTNHSLVGPVAPHFSLDYGLVQVFRLLDVHKGVWMLAGCERKARCAEIEIGTLEALVTDTDNLGVTEIARGHVYGWSLYFHRHVDGLVIQCGRDDADGRRGLWLEPRVLDALELVHMGVLGPPCRKACVAHVVVAAVLTFPAFPSDVAITDVALNVRVNVLALFRGLLGWFFFLG
jgi:hypothetical protein